MDYIRLLLHSDIIMFWFGVIYFTKIWHKERFGSWIVDDCAKFCSQIAAFMVLQISEWGLNDSILPVLVHTYIYTILNGVGNTSNLK